MRRDRTQIGAWQGRRGRGSGRNRLNGCGVLYWSLVNVLERDRGGGGVVVTGRWVIHVKMVDITLCEFHLNNLEFSKREFA